MLSLIVALSAVGIASAHHYSAPVDRTETRRQKLEDVVRAEAWDNGNENVWSLYPRALFAANHIVVPTV